MQLTIKEYRDNLKKQLGFCPDCEEFTTENINPDAELCKCAECDEFMVHGIDASVMRGFIQIKPQKSKN